MKFIIDAHLPRRIALLLRRRGHDAIHTLDLPRNNRTTDREIKELSIRECRVVVSKDSDFVDSFVLERQPYKLLQVTTGNIRNAELERLLMANLGSVLQALESHDYVELSRTSVVVKN